MTGTSGAAERYAEQNPDRRPPGGPAESGPDDRPREPHGVRTSLRRRGARLTVQGWFHLALALMGVLVIVGTVVGSQLLTRTAHVSDRMISHLDPARTEAYRLQTALVDQETGVRGYAIAADAQFLQPYATGRQIERQSADRIRTALAGRPDLLADLNAIEKAADAWRRTNAEPLIAHVTPGAPRPVDRSTAERGKAAFDRVRSLFTAQNTHLTQAGARAHRDLAHVRTVRDGVLGGMIAVFLLTGAALAVLLRVLVARPLHRLRTSSQRVADGDFVHRISAYGPQDLQTVAEAVEGMRRRILAELDSSRAQQETLTRQAADLDAQAEELRRSNAELEQFAYVASHDLQEPLRKVASFCQLLEKRYGDRLDERGLQYVDFAVDGAKRMQVLINDLLTFSRVGRVNDAWEPLPLAHSLDKALANVDLEDSGAVIERPEELPQVTGDPTLLVMLWQNLLGNALKFRAPDRPPVVSVTCEPEPDAPGMWRLCVSDNGIGIPAEFTEKVFVIFQRLHGRDAYGGTGIGLAIAKKIVEYHGGRIWIDTAHAPGARFCFTLPAAEVPAEAEPDHAAAPGVPS
jgi:signal transduction histidine kinase